MAAAHSSLRIKERHLAHERGHFFYCVVTPCRNGHLSPRLVRNGECLDCRAVDRARYVRKWAPKKRAKPKDVWGDSFTFDPADIERFVKCTNPNQEKGCWLWLGRLDKQGYGAFFFKSARLGAHRVSYRLFRGPIAEGLMVCHSCDVPHCVNPEHLFLGTAYDNAQDCVNKGRKANCAGTANSQAVLSEADVLAIRWRVASGERVKDLAKEYSVSAWTIHAAAKRKTWAHLA